MFRRSFRSFFLIASLLLMAAMIIPAQEYLVDYVEGLVEVRDGDQWYELFIADTILDSDEIRVSDGAYLELSSGRAAMKITRPGIYAVAGIVSQSQRREQTGLGSLLTNQIGRFSQEEVRTESTVGGVRASEAAKEDEPTWVGGESVPELIAEAVTMLEAGNYEEAYYIMDEASYYAFGNEKPEADFYLGYTASLVGETQTAFASLEAHEPDPDADYYDSHVLTLADLYVQTFAYEEAESLIEAYLARGEGDPESAQHAHLLLGMSRQGRGDQRGARTAFQEARDLAPESPAGQVARNFLAGF
ncbi:MAG: hypothetical protein ACLFO1_10135 [Spirochaetaceae bacterium]